MKKGLVLEGGGMRGLFTAGVMDVFLENNIVFDAAVGVSAGAAFGCNYKSKQIGRVVRYAKRFCNYWKFCSFRSWFITGDVFGAQFCYYEIPLKLDVFDEETYENNPMDFYVVATDIRTGEGVYHLMEDCNKENMEWMRASASQPVFSRPVKINGSLYLDGGMKDNIPLEFMQQKGFERNIVILTQPEGFIKKQMKVMPLIRLFTLRYPEIAKALYARPDNYNRQTAYVKACEDRGDTLVIRPEVPLDLKTMVHDPDELQRAYDHGRETALKRMEEVKRFMSV